MGLTKLALKRPVSMALIVLALVVFGLSSIPGFRLELTPDIEMPMLLVYTIYPGGPGERGGACDEGDRGCRFRTERRNYLYFAVGGKYVHGYVSV